MKENFFKKTKIFGYDASLIIGIILMFIPFFISINYTVIKNFLWIEKTDKILLPKYEATILSCAFYVALIVRYDFFKKDNLGEIIISTVQAFLNIWVLAAIISIALGDKGFQIEFLIIAVAFSWLGMKTIAGYSWAAFIVLAVIAFRDTIKGANSKPVPADIFFIFSTISLYLQVSNVTDFRNFLQDFRGVAYKAGESIGEKVNIAANDANEKAHAAIEFAEKHVKIPSRNSEKKSEGNNKSQNS